MKLDIINGEHQGLIFPAWRLVFSMTSKGIILPVTIRKSQKEEKYVLSSGRVRTLDPYHRYS